MYLVGKKIENSYFKSNGQLEAGRGIERREGYGKFLFYSQNASRRRGNLTPQCSLLQMLSEPSGDLDEAFLLVEFDNRWLADTSLGQCQCTDACKPSTTAETDRLFH